MSPTPDVDYQPLTSTPYIKFSFVRHEYYTSKQANAFETINRALLCSDFSSLPQLQAVETSSSEEN
ncbi:hypothetical protein HI914_03228 [Erysiphe necator]|nr:hypothetical protein HI914_03228 [Erysiphe necator]